MNTQTPKIDRTNFIIPFSWEGEDYTIWIPQPTPQELRAIAKLLGEIFNALSKDANPMVLMQDWDIMLEEICERISPLKATELKNQLEAFFERKILDGNVFSNEGLNVKDCLNEDVLHAIKATVLFLSALLRYASPTLKMSDTKDLVTSRTAMEFKSYLARLYKDSTATEKSKASAMKSSNLS